MSESEVFEHSHQVETRQVDYLCPFCHLVNLRVVRPIYNDEPSVLSVSELIGWLHKCPHCKEEIILRKSYPHIVYVLIHEEIERFDEEDV